MGDICREIPEWTPDSNVLSGAPENLDFVFVARPSQVARLASVHIGWPPADQSWRATYFASKVENVAHTEAALHIERQRCNNLRSPRAC